MSHSRWPHLSAITLLLGLAACADGPTTPRAAPAGGAQARAAAPAGDVLADRYIVVFRDPVADPPGLARQLTAAHGGTLHHTYRHAIKGFAATLPAGAVDAIRRNPNVKYVENDGVARAAQAASWGLDRVDQRDLPLNGGYLYDRTGAGVTVYVIDTGIETGHWDFGGRARPGYDVYGENSPDCNGHGTHVAGTVGGSTYGVAKSAGLVAVRVLGCNGYGTWSGVIAGIDWVRYVRTLPAVANLSLGGWMNQAVDDAVQSLVLSGVTVVAAAGNSSEDACNISPARAPNALTVAAANEWDQHASFSNWGACVDLYGPGVNITSAWPGGMAVTISGTSMAAPHVAGAAALYLQGNPSAAPSTVNAAVVGNATPNRLSGVPVATPNRLVHTLFGALPGARMAVHRLSNPGNGDHMYGVDPGEGLNSGYYLEAGNYFYTATTPLPGHVPLYRCHTWWSGDHFLSTDAGCEGVINEYQVGYIATYQPPGSVALYRQYSPVTGDTFHTIDAWEAQNAVTQYGYHSPTVTGYVYP